VTVHEVGPASRSYNTSAAIALPGGPVQASVSGDVSNRRLGELIGFADLSWEEDDGGSVIEVPADDYDELIISENHGGDLHLLVYDLAARVEDRKAMHGLGADDASLVLILPGWAADAGHSFAVDDLDADGSADLIIGDPDRLSNQGCVQIAWGPFHGVAAPPNDVPVETLSTLTELCGAANERIGKSVATGDFDGDAYRDLAIGADREYVGAPHARAYVVFGDAICGAPDCSGRLEGELLPIGASALRLESTSGLSRLGDMVRVLGDVNGDGADDLAVGSRSVSGLRVFVLSGTALASATSTWTVPAVSTPGAVAVITGNSRVETVGDLTGDGLAELAVARPDDGSNSGIVRVFYGDTGFFDQTSNLNYTCVDSQSCGSLGGKALTQSLPEAKWGMAVLGAPVMAPGVNDLIALGDQWDDGSGIERWVVDVVPWSNPFARLTCPTGP
jgi:hypothetical protein